MAAEYTDTDVRRAAKTVAAACQGVFDAHMHLAKSLGELLGIMDSLDNYGPEMSPRAKRLEPLMAALGAAYDAIADELQSGLE